MRPIGEETVNDELFIAFNGPEIGEADQTLKSALDLHFSSRGGRWHFSTNSLFKTAGPTVTKKLQKKNKLNIY